MQAISRIALVAALMTPDAHAQSAQPPVPSEASVMVAPAARASTEGPTQPGATIGPVKIDHPPEPPELSPLSQDFQAAMANSQLQTYRYNQLTEQALALKKLCDTGFGPVDICPRAAATPLAAGAVLADGSADRPIVAEITGAGHAMSAVLVLPDGRRVTVEPGSTLPDGSTVAAISGGEVRLSHGSGRSDAVLPFGQGGRGK